MESGLNAWVVGGLCGVAMVTFVIIVMHIIQKKKKDFRNKFLYAILPLFSRRGEFLSRRDVREKVLERMKTEQPSLVKSIERLPDKQRIEKILDEILEVSHRKHEEANQAHYEKACCLHAKEVEKLKQLALVAPFLKSFIHAKSAQWQMV
jgi:hypothetical protein